MIARISTTVFICNEQHLWKEIINPKSLQFVASSLLSFRPLVESDFDEEWATGKLYEFEPWLLKVLPIGRHRIRLMTINRKWTAARWRRIPATSFDPLSLDDLPGLIV
jgi:hypothetical protein